MNTHSTNIVERWDSAEHEDAVLLKPPADKPHWSLRIALSFSVSAVVLLPLWFGGKSQTVVSLLSLVVFLFAGGVCFDALRGRSAQVAALGPAARMLLLPMVIFVGIVFLQLIPFPLSVLAWISPSTEEAYRLAGVSSQATLSVDRGLSASQLSWLLALGLIFYWLMRLPQATKKNYLFSSSRRRPRSRDSLLSASRKTDRAADVLITGITASALLCAIIALAHWTLRSHYLFGIFESRFGPISTMRAHWPFINPDHLSVLLEIGIMLSAGRVLRLQQIRRLRVSDRSSDNLSLRVLQSPANLGAQLPWGIALLVMCLANVLALSRAGNILVVFGLGLLLAAYLLIPVRPRYRAVWHDTGSSSGIDFLRRVFGASGASFFKWGASVLVFISVLLFFLGQTGRDLAVKRIEYGLAAGYDDSRYLLALASLRAFVSSPVFGSGLGTWHLAVGESLPPELAGWTLDYAHNDYLQLLVETGLLGLSCGIAGLTIVLFFTRKAFGRAKLPMQRFELISVTIALLLPLLHALVDFPFHIPSLAVIFTILLAVQMRLVERIFTHSGV